MHNLPMYSRPDVAGRQPGRLLSALVLSGFLVALLLLSTGFGPPILTDRNDAPIRLSPENIAALIQTNVPPTVTAASVLMIELPSGATLFEKASVELHPPASTAKLMTALVVRAEVPLDDVAVITPTAAGTGGSSMGLVAGERLTVSDLLHGLLLPSGNDAAVALAEHVAGSEADFVAMMNARARAIGLQSTRFANAHGLDAPDQLTTALDLALLASAAMQDAELANIVAKPVANVAGRALVNTNELLSTYAGADGVKTGTTDEAGECLIAAVSRNSRRLLLVELGSSERYEDARKLLDYAATAFAWHDVRLPQGGLSWITASNGDAYRLRSDPTSDIFVPAWQRSLLLPVVQIDASLVLTGTDPA